MLAGVLGAGHGCGVDSPSRHGTASARRQTSLCSGDGTILRANVYYPTAMNGQAAPGPFPGDPDPDPVRQGQQRIRFRARRRRERLSRAARLHRRRRRCPRNRRLGRANGACSTPSRARTARRLVAFAAALPHRDGNVGLFGASYLGIDQFATAVDAGPAHVKAMFPIISGNELYRDTAFAGGFPDIEFSAFYLGLTGAGSTCSLPSPRANPDFADRAGATRAATSTSFDASLVAGVETGGDQAYDQKLLAARATR